MISGDDLMSLINDLNRSDLFTKSELTVINYIKKYPNKVINMSINELALQTFSSNTSIIRICKKLGFKGFKEFKMALATSLESNKYINHDTDYSFPFKENDTTLNIINNISNLYKNTLDLINTELNINDLNEMVHLLNECQNVYIFASGDTNITAQRFVNKLVKIGKFYHLANRNGDYLSFSQFATKNDCCFFLSYDKNEIYYDAFRTALNNNAKTIVITANKKTILYKYADYHIAIPHQESDQKIATFYSQQAFDYILNIIFSLLYNLNQ